MAKLRLKPPIFTNDDLFAIAQVALSSDAIGRLVVLLQHVRLFRYSEIKALSPQQALELTNLAILLDQEVSATLLQFLQESGLLIDNELDLDLMGEENFRKNAPFW